MTLDSPGRRLYVRFIESEGIGTPRSDYSFMSPAMRARWEKLGLAVERLESAARGVLEQRVMIDGACGSEQTLFDGQGLACGGKGEAALQALAEAVWG